MIQAQSFRQRLEEINDAAIEITRADMGNIQLVTDGALRIVQQRGFDSSFLEFFDRVDTGQCACARALLTGQRVIIGDVAQSPELAGTAEREALLNAGVRAVQSTPLLTSSGEILGMISTHFRLPSTLKEHDLRLLDLLARQAGDLIESSLNGDALRTTQERFQALVTTSSEAVYRMSPDWSEMHYLRGRNFIPDTDDPNRGWLEKYIHASDQPRILEAIQNAIRNKSTFELEHRVVRADGSAGWTFSRAVPLFDAQGEIIEWFGTAQDITQRKQSEDALARLTTESDQQRRLYHTILANTPDLVYVFDLRHRFTYANEALLGMWGKTAEEAIGRNCLELGYEPWHAAMHDREIEQVIATKQPVRGEVPFTGTQGRRIYDYIFVPVIGVNGEVEAIAGTTRDVTDRKLAEEQLREAAERFRFMAESMPQKIFTTRPNGQVEYFNRQWIEFTGMNVEQAGAAPWSKLVHPNEVPECNLRWRVALETGEPFVFTHRFRRADGAYRWHLCRAHAMRDRDGKIMMWIGSTTDIHEQKRAEEELRRANQDLEQFAYSASHDLQEPLRGVKIYSELLEKKYRENLDGQALVYLNFLRSGATRMEMLVRDLLAYTQTALHDEPAELVEAEECLKSAVANLAEAISESDAGVGNGPLPAVRVHPPHLRQLFQNLVGNAIKYRRRDIAAEVRVDAMRQNGNWLFAVRDNGIGIEPEYHERIFGLFKRLHTKDEHSGTGIGLAICHKIVDRYHGRIWVESEPGAGSTFYFTLPAQ